MNDFKNLRELSGIITTEDLLKEEQIDEALGMTIAHPILSGKSLELFTAEMKRWKDAGFLSKWQKNRMFTKIKLFFTGIEEPYVITITGLLGKDEEEGNTRKEKLKSRLVGKVKSPYRFFKTFNRAGFYDIAETLFDIVEDDVDKGKVAKSQNLEDEAASDLEDKISKSMEMARKKVAVFRQIDAGNFAVSMSMSEDVNTEEGNMDIRDSIKKNSGLLSEMALQEMAKVDMPQNYKDPKDFLNQYVANYEKRMGKPFTAAGVAGLKKTLSGTTLPEGEAEEIASLAAKRFPKSATSRGGAPTFSDAEIKAAKKFIAAVGDKATMKLINAAKKA